MKPITASVVLLIAAAVVFFLGAFYVELGTLDHLLLGLGLATTSLVVK